MSNSTNEWYVARDGRAVGPYTMAQLQADARAGTLKQKDQVWREGLPAWVQAGGLVEIFSPSTPPGATTNSGARSAPATSAPPPPLPPQPVGYATPQARPTDIGQDAGMRMLIPVGRSGWAIASGYLGLFSFFPLVALVTGPAAVLTGVLAIRQIKRDPNKHGMGRAVFGIITGGLLFVVNAVGAVILLAEELPNW